MALINEKPLVANLDFNDVKDDILTHFRNRPEFTDYDFTGSALNLLIDILTYNTHYNSLTANFMLNEAYLDSAVIRANVVSLAKALNYTPRSASAAFTTLTLRFTKADLNDSAPIMIPAGSAFKAAAAGLSFTFHTVEDYSVQFKKTDLAGTTIDIDVGVYEGSYHTQRFEADGTVGEFTRYEIPQDNVDTSKMTVSVNGLRYVQVIPEEENIFGVTGDSKIYFVEESRNGYPVIVFGNDVTGDALQANDEVLVTYLQTNGSAGNSIKTFTGTVSGRPDMEIAVVNGPTSGGAGRETIQEIKDNAPHWFASQYRAVTEDDYEVLLRKHYPDIQAVSVYGGEEVYTPGRVYMAVKPKSGDKLSDAAKEILRSQIIDKYNVVTITPVFVDPQIVKVILSTTVIYDETKLVDNPNQLAARVKNLYSYMNNNYISNFLSTFHESNFSYELRSLDSAVLGSNTRVSLKVETGVNNYLLDTNKFQLYNKLYHPQDGFKADQGGILKTNLFKRLGQTVQSGLDDDGYGKIRLFNVVENEKIYVNYDAGVINYETGEFEIKFNMKPEEGPIEFTVIPESFDVIAENNVILEIDDQASTVNVIEKNDKDLMRYNNLSRSF
ncbi:MAG: hypothetical protein N0C84_00865 [Candidatus Thiodiazotropha taylori]|uniref:Baseplate wedge protein gp6-like N-terminal helical domain-containing protein n=1 Tax=Candidatus Thiodiazotropha taylori TaxID=2792791 RepID=A0A9E4K863_9GAMM|nr:hypothetical protein [Candidatus Thiodiazotropha taylori]MCW4254996.1 hypothetical protein [Candidatus Thiodiazotropha taylori]